MKVWNTKDILQVSRQFLTSDEFGNKDNIDLLREVLHFHEWRYYVKNDPLIADKEYDRLFQLLKNIESAYPELLIPESPTQRVGNALTKDFPAVEHSLPMLSLDNSYNEADLYDWSKRVHTLCETDDVEYVVEPKLDGSSIALIYENDLFLRAATRGNGIQGEAISENARVIHSIPLKAGFSLSNISKVEIRGEIVIAKNTFKAFNHERMEQGLPIMANPRNAAAGALRMINPEEVAKRGLTAIIYQLGLAVDKHGRSLLGSEILSHSQALQVLESAGFKTTFPQLKICNSINEVLHIIHQWDSKRDIFPFETDGMVIKVNRFDQQKKCGITAHHPRWAMAFKFKAKQATTRLIDVEYQVGRTGTINPVAKLEPVALAGVTISSVSLFNEDLIKEKKLMIGDMVLVERAGEVIPYIVKPVIESRTGLEKPIQFPNQCPSCGSTLFRTGEEVAWRCINASCPAQTIEKLKHFVSKNAMDIDGLGEKMIARLYHLNLLKQIPDIYTLDFEAISRLEGYGQKSAEKLKMAIETSKHQPLYRLIFALGIRFVGQQTAKTIAKSIGNLKDLYKLKDEDLMQLNDIGTKVASSIVDFMANPSNRILIDTLESHGVNFNSDSSLTKSNLPLAGKTFLFTGSLQSLSRSKASEMLEQLGAKVMSSVTNKLDYLVVGKSPGSKLTKAQTISSIKIMNEQEFLKFTKDL